MRADPEYIAIEELAVRSATSGDIPLLMEIDHGYSTDHVWQMGYRKGPDVAIDINFREVRLPRPMRVVYPRDPQMLADEWTQRAVILLVTLHSEILGYSAVTFAPVGGASWITDLVVDIRHRRQGIGSRLLEATIHWTRAQGLTRIFMEMQTKNYPAIKLAQKYSLTFAGYSDAYYVNQDIALFFVGNC